MFKVRGQWRASRKGQEVAFNEADYREGCRKFQRCNDLLGVSSKADLVAMQDELRV